MIKKQTQDTLKVYGISKEHPEFKELYNMVHRGVMWSFVSRFLYHLRACAANEAF